MAWRPDSAGAETRRDNLIEALGLTSGILKSILGACSNQPVSAVRENLFHALSLAENDGISIFGAAGASNLGMSVWKSNFGQPHAIDAT